MRLVCYFGEGELEPDTPKRSPIMAKKTAAKRTPEQIKSDRNDRRRKKREADRAAKAKAAGKLGTAPGKGQRPTKSKGTTVELKASKRKALTATELAGLGDAERKKRLTKLYRLEGELETKRASYAASKKTTASHKRALGTAEAALEKELDEQRFGPGPLFDATGSGPAK